MTTNLPTTQTRSTAVGFASAESFELMQRVAQAFSGSDLVPEAFKGKLGNCVIGVELAQRIGASPLMVMQNLNVIHGRPAFSSKFIISAINTCGRFSPLRFRIEKRGMKKVKYTYSVWNDQIRKKERKNGEVEIEDVACTAYATDLASGEILDGPTVSIEMAVLEGWYTKTDSKWKTMPDVMLRYRAASFFGNLYAPEILMGMQSAEEVHDIIDVTPQPEPAAEAAGVTADLNAQIQQNATKRRGRPPRQSAPEAPATETLPVIEVQETQEPVQPNEPNAELVESEEIQSEDGGLWDE